MHSTKHLQAYTRIGTNRAQPRLWLETSRLTSLGFIPKTPLRLEIKHNRLDITVANTSFSQHHVSSRSTRSGIRPIIDINNRQLLTHLLDYDAIRVDGTYNRLSVLPTNRAFYIANARQLKPPFKVLELFTGGGTISGALATDPRFTLVAGAELENDYADIWEQAHPEARLLLGDIRDAHSSEIPQHDILVAGIPCTSHSLLGRAKKKLAQKPEAGDSGDLFIPVLNCIQSRPPLAVILENVPSFANSLAGILITKTLTSLGYGIFQTILEPNEQWNEPSDRRRWLLVATLKGTCVIQAPNQPNLTTVNDLIDPPNPEQDNADVQRIAKTIAGRIAHHKRHQAAGHGFGFTVLEGHETTIPVIPKSYQKINIGPFLKTTFGLRLLRQHELERIHGHQVHTHSASLAAEIIGQGVLPGIFKSVFHQLGDFLCNPTPPPPTLVTPPAAQPEFNLELAI